MIVSSADDHELDDSEGVIYYVKPSQSSRCPNSSLTQPCEMLQYYFDNVDTTLNQHKNVTMIFLTGNHTVVINSTDAIFIIVPVIRMIGEHEGITVLYNAGSFFPVYFLSNVNVVVFKNLQLIRWFIEVHSMENLALSEGRDEWLLSELVLTNSAFHNTQLLVLYSFDVRLRDCSFIDTPLITRSCSNVILSGSTYFTETLMNKEPAIQLYQGNITLSGNVSLGQAN